MPVFRLSSLLCLPAVLLLSAYSPDDPPIERLEPDVQGEEQGEPGRMPESSTARAIHEAVTADILETRLPHVSEGVRTAARQAYALRVFDPIWTRDGAEALLAAFDEAETVGLTIAPSLRDSVREQSRFIGADSPERASEADIILTSAFLAYADARTNGATDPDKVADPLTNKISPERLALWLAEAGEGRLDHGKLDPDHDEFDRLVEIRARYQDYAEAGGWVALEPPGTLVETGEREPVIADLRTRLDAEGYDVPDPPMREVEVEDSEETRQEPDDTLLTEDLAAVLTEFQADRGLKEDGIVGPRTLGALNTPPEDLVARIDANLERWRWAPGQFPDRHIRVNIPAYRVRAWEDGEIAVEMKAIVGLVGRKTPMLTESIEYLVANPRWYVPESILRRDKLEDIRANSDYIATHDYYVLDRATGERVSPGSIDWNAAGVEEHYRLVQKSGDENALGELKFIFPNPQSIYLHGTPAQHLFAHNLRSFSSGCIRIMRPLEMADWIASNDPELTPHQVRESVGGTDLQRLYLGEPLAIYTLYFSVERSEDGETVFHPDIYGWDDATIAALENNPIAFADVPEGDA